MPSTDGHYGSLENDPQKVAESRGLVLVLDQPDLLMLDIDTKQQYERFGQVFHWHEVRSLVADHRIVASNSGNEDNNHKHIYIRLTEVQPIGERLALQAALGSDPNRGLMDSLRIFMHKDHIPLNVLFETPEAYESLKDFLG